MKQITQVFQTESQLSQSHLEALAERIRSVRHALEQPLVSSPAQLDAPWQTSKSSRLLVVDDDEGLVHQLMNYASAWGVEVTAASNPADARRMMAEDRPDVVLLDLSFSNYTEDGFSVLAEISAGYPTIPVLVFTVHESLADRVKAVRLGGAAFLHKPLSPTRVLGSRLPSYTKKTADRSQPVNFG